MPGLNRIFLFSPAAFFMPPLAGLDFLTLFFEATLLGVLLAATFPFGILFQICLIFINLNLNFNLNTLNFDFVKNCGGQNSQSELALTSLS